MSVNAGERNVPDTPQNRQLDACWKARGLALHTFKICKNKNIFLPEYQSVLTDDLIKLAKNIYLKVWRANNIRVIKREHWSSREKLQISAILDCNDLLATIGLARPLFHLKGKKEDYWSELVKETRVLIAKWHESDAKRYSNVK
nr:MAG TPA: Avd-like protein [Caudoviricetes sp.]